MDSVDSLMGRMSKDISSWVNIGSAFGHVQINRFITVPKRAAILIKACSQANNTVIYAAGSDRERCFLAAQLNGDIAKEIDSASRVCVVAYSQLYQWAKKLNRDGTAGKGFVVICEMDIHYSLEFALSMVCLAECHKSSSYIKALIVSPQALDSSLVRAFELVASSAFHIEHFTLNLEPLHNPRYIELDDESSIEMGLGRVKETLGSGKNVLMFCQPSERDMFIRELDKSVLWNCRLSTSQVDTSYLIDFCRPFSSHPESTLIFVENESTFPISIANLGLIVVSNLRQASIFDPHLRHVVRTTVARSMEEMNDILSHVYLLPGDGHKNVLVVGHRLESFKDQSPPRRVENDQNIAFLFEVLQICPEVKLAELISCFVTDTRTIRGLIPRLLVGGWIQEEPSPEVCRGYVVSPTVQAKKLISLLPIFGYEFEPAAFLAGFVHDGNLATLRGAIRMAAISHQGFDFFQPYDPVQLAHTKNQPLYRVLEEFPNSLEYHRVFPKTLSQHGILWIALATWHSAVGDGGSKAVTAASSASRLPQINLRLANQIGGLVDKLEKLFDFQSRFGPLSSPSLELQIADCDRIHDELIKAWMFRACLVRHRGGYERRNVSIQSIRVVDLVGGKVRTGMLSDTDARLLADALKSEEADFMGEVDNDAIACVIAKNIVKMDNESCLVEPMAIIPLATIRRWEQSQELKFDEIFKSKYPAY